LEITMNTTQQYGATTFTTPSDTQVVCTRTFNAPRDRVFDAWVNPKIVPQWMTGPDGWTMPVCEIDLRPGGQWHFVWKMDDGKEMAMTGQYKEIARPSRLVNTEAWGGDWAESTNTLVLTDDAGKTKTVCTVDYPTKKDRDRAVATGMFGGWAQSYDKLEQLLSKNA
jgi:uncharacterized protein YndB with AHSA1/START domain